MNPRVSIIVLNWNGWRDTIECLESLYQINYPEYDVIVVDNGSEDESLQKIREYITAVENSLVLVEYTRQESEYEIIKDKKNKSKRLVLIKNEKNYGFAEGNNIGMRYALKLNPSYILLLNNDTVVDPSFLRELIDIAESDERIGAVQPKILRKENPHLIDSAGQEIYWDGTVKDIWFGKTDDGQFDSVHEIFGACGAAALMKRSVLEETGLFDRDYFLIFEDVDLSWRIRLKGYASVFVPSSLVYHKRRISKDESPKGRYYSSRNKLLIVFTYFPFLYILLFFYVYSYQFLVFFFLSRKFGGRKSMVEFLKKMRNCVLKRETVMHSPYYRETFTRWVEIKNCWHRPKIGNLTNT